MKSTRKDYISPVSVDLLTWGLVLGSGQLKQKNTKGVSADTMRVVTVHSVYEMSFGSISAASQPQGRENVHERAREISSFQHL